MSELDMRVLDQDLRFIEEAIKGLHEPVGSPAYVRRLRDQAAVAALGGMLANPDLDRFGFGRDGQTPGDVAVEEANRTVLALGYQVPEDAP